MDEKHLTIKNLSIEDRPREKLLSKGISALSTSELLAIIIGSGNKTLSAVELAKHILNTYNNNLNKIGKLTVSDLMQFNGIGEAKAISIITALELSKRRELENNEEQKITSSKNIFDIMNPLLTDLNYEEFWILYLNRSNKLIKKTKHSQGGISSTITDIRLVLKEALLIYSSSIILVHNHPSGNLVPSNADKEITKKIKEAAKLFDISILDHLIIGENSYYSFADEAIL
jgi:DNA repair protein RadC